MIEKSDSSGIFWIEFQSFSEYPIKHAFFQRSGGVSSDPWTSLNMGGGLGDDPKNTIENKRRALSALEITPKKTYDVWQVHSTEIVKALIPRLDGESYIKADGMTTNLPDLGLVMRFADCVPIMIYDPARHAIGIAHAGWKGTVHNIAGSLVESMVTEYESAPNTLLAGIGPSICQEHYQVGTEVVSELAEKISAEELDQVVAYHDGKPHLDLWKTNGIFLTKAGVEKIEFADICTACDTAKWFSHRGEQGRTGRFGAVIQLL